MNELESVNKIEYLASIFFDKIKIGQTFKLNGYTYEVNKGRKIDGRVSKFTIVRTGGNKRLTFPIIETHNIRYSGWYKRRQHNPFQHLVRDLEGILAVDFINEKNPLHAKSDIYNICTL